MTISEKIFRAYDVRGEYPGEINAEVASEIARAAVRKFKKSCFWGKPKIIVGHDVRLSSSEIYTAVLRAIADAQGRAIPIGLATTPMLYYLANTLRAAGGIMVTASHNPKNWNGLKVVGKRGAAISGEDLLRLIQS